MILNDQVILASGLIEKVYEQPGGGVGGGLHIVVDDWNLEDDSIEWCMKKRTLGAIRPVPIEIFPTSIEMECARTLLSMSIQERASALALSEGWLLDAIAEECKNE